MYVEFEKVMETALASTISLRAIGGGVKIVRANHGPILIVDLT